MPSVGNFSQKTSIEKVIAGRCYVVRKTVAPMASQTSLVEIVNPVGSGVLIAVSRITVLGSADGQAVNIKRKAGAAVGYNNIDVVQKFLKTSFATDIPIAQTGAGHAAYSGFPLDVLTTGKRDTWALNEPLIVAEGMSLAAVHATVNTLLTAVFEWEEIPL